LSDALHFIVENVDEIFQKIEENCHMNSYAKHHKIILKHLCKIGYIKKLDVWLVHDLTLKNLID